MAQFQVPQFIETEDKIIGPLTLRQFMYLAVAGALSGVCYLLFQPILAVMLMLVFMGLAGVLAFAKVNGRTMVEFLGSAFGYVWGPKLYIFTIKKDDGTHLTQKEKVLTDSHNAASGLREIGDQIAVGRNAAPKREQALPPPKSPQKKEIEERYEMVREQTGAREEAKRIDYR